MVSDGRFEQRNRFWLSHDVRSIDELLDAGFSQSFDLFVHEGGAPHHGLAGYGNRCRAFNQILDDIRPLIDSASNVALVRNEGETPYVQIRSNGHVERFPIDRYTA